MRSVWLAYYTPLRQTMVAIIVADSEAEALEYAGDKAERVERVALEEKGRIGVYYV